VVLTHFNPDELSKHLITVFDVEINGGHKMEIESEFSRRLAHSCQSPGAIRCENTDSH
jgi:hypothetical protein